MNNSETITSKENTKFKEIKSLSENAGIVKNNKILISGKKIILELLRENCVKSMELIVHEDYKETDKELLDCIASYKNKNALIVLSKILFNELDIFRTKSPLLIAALPNLDKWNDKTLAGCTVLLPFQNPVNIGSAIRSAAAMGAGRVVLLKEAANPFHPKSIRASSGTVFKVKLLYGPSLDEIISNTKSYSNLITLDMKGRDLSHFSFPENFILLPGVEGQGLPQKVRNMAISIPMQSGVESLNASVSISIVLWEWKRRIGAK
ncbi:MAG: hypothetical protein A2015_06755 [Spirochaetes bacterium GWF1_31_7]|nr:MAG: hypothetical protein A2Y30_09705 [Spirochaetes bacterium GWE1_32_154]OHD46531.1 MAG: hypothetical protein A2015_06755 [Spirochaetes bacterium GWF1_31_7]OHD49340.1 MAG: hypothetical protein A2Y29_03750 [Spirochaetes bacterium GWE2_31_10]OHD79441.1 MAG: hypothetical protein A2355_15270 [Spirochaetes bacterium RIFOXYB1_FULL_32_8]